MIRLSRQTLKIKFQVCGSSILLFNAKFNMSLVPGVAHTHISSPPGWDIMVVYGKVELESKANSKIVI